MEEKGEYERVGKAMFLYDLEHHGGDQKVRPGLPDQEKAHASLARRRLTRIDAVKEWAVSAGWIDGEGTDALYVSAGRDARPLTYLGPGPLKSIGLPPSVVPEFFVYVDAGRESLREPNGFDADQRTTISILDTERFRLGEWGCRLDLVEIKSDRSSPRKVVRLAVPAKNSDFGDLAAAQGWSPTWFIGIRDGCRGYGGQVPHDPAWGFEGKIHRCENELGPLFPSIPLQLGSRFWLADHLNHNGDVLNDFGEERFAIGEEFSLSEGSALKLRYRWRRWPGTSSSGSEAGVSLYDIVHDTPSNQTG